MQPTLLVDDGTLLSTGGTASVRRGHSILVEDGFIAKVAPSDQFKGYKGERVAAAGRVVVPGLINAHTHLYSAFARGLAKAKPSKDFIGVLRNLWWRLDSALTAEDCYHSALVALSTRSVTAPPRSSTTTRAPAP